MSSLIANPFAATSQFEGAPVHLGITGSVACYKSCELARCLLRLGISLSATLTSAAARFVQPLLFSSLGVQHVYGEMFEDSDIFAHLRAGKEARAICIAPASANSIAEFAHGMAGNMLAAQFLAFQGPRVIAPAMNPLMWSNEATQANIKILEDRGCIIVPPAMGLAACGDKGQGRLADVAEIFFACLRSISPQDLEGKKILVTLGATREYWDEMRFWTNPSSGKMGAALATAAWLRGAEVIVAQAATEPMDLPSGIAVYPVTSAQHMRDTVGRLWPGMDWGLFCAAVADFAPAEHPMGKFAKAGAEDLQIRFGRTPDVLMSCAATRKPAQKILAFAAESAPDMEILLELGRQKLRRKKADLLAANQITGEHSAFGSSRSALAVTDLHGNEQIWQARDKSDSAWDLLTWLSKL